MKPLLAHIYEPHRVTYPCYVQPKLNGIRALYQNGHFQSRDQLPFPSGLLQHLVTPLLSVFDPSVILDGELYVHGWPLQRINAAVTPVRQRPTEDTLKVEYHVFDVVDFGKEFSRRFVNTELDHLRDIFFNFRGKFVCQGVTKVPTWHAKNEEKANEWYADFVSLGYEGMMYRLGDCPYTVPKQPAEYGPKGSTWKVLDNNSNKWRTPFLSDKNNRCWHLLKRKDWQDDEYNCVGVQEGEGKYKGMTGAFICLTPEGKTFTVGSGVTDSERIHYWEHPPINQLIKVKYLVLSSDGIPLNPTILAVL